MPLHGKDNLLKAIDKKVDDLNDKVRAAFFFCVSEVIKGTPVDTGETRAKWQGSAEKLPKKVLGKSFRLFNNMPNIIKLEYGGYQQPGTSKTVNGFSTQAPSGWVRAALIRTQNRIKKL